MEFRMILFFDPKTTIGFTLPQKINVKLMIYNSTRQKLADLVDREFEPGTYHVTWNVNDLPWQACWLDGGAGGFNFYPGKNLGAYGEGGAVITNKTELDERIRILRDHGQNKKYYHSMIGWNYRMDDFQGAILNAKLKRLAVWNEARRNKVACW
jgi:hypothetical protein